MSSIKATGSESLVFCSIVHPDRNSERNALLLVESIRAFAGSLSENPVWCYVPEHGEQLSTDAMDRLLALGVTLIPFIMDPEVARFPFTGEAQAAAAAEAMALGKADLVAWMNANTIVLQEPKSLLLQEGKSLGYRPVHHTNIGSRYDGPLDPFWALVYSLCDVPEDRVFPMVTHVDGETIRPYFNAGYHVTRPERGLLRAWRDAYMEAYREPMLQAFYQQDPRYRVFVHQAVLTGVILSHLSADELHELPPEHNYPIHLYSEDVTEHRPTIMEELVSIRHEGFYADPDWARKMPAGEPLKRWITERLP
jgi:hypothetical protein